MEIIEGRSLAEQPGKVRIEDRDRRPMDYIDFTGVKRVIEFTTPTQSARVRLELDKGKRATFRADKIRLHVPG